MSCTRATTVHVVHDSTVKARLAMDYRFALIGLAQVPSLCDLERGRGRKGGRKGDEDSVAR